MNCNVLNGQTKRNKKNIGGRWASLEKLPDKSCFSAYIILWHFHLIKPWIRHEKYLYLFSNLALTVCRQRSCRIRCRIHKRLRKPDQPNGILSLGERQALTINLLYCRPSVITQFGIKYQLSKHPRYCCWNEGFKCNFLPFRGYV